MPPRVLHHAGGWPITPNPEKEETMSTMSVPQDTEPAGTPRDPFRLMAEFFQMWLSGARHREILRLLELVGEELARRGYALTHEVRRHRPGAEDGEDER